ncbi:Wzz/FepE/Etk N-terminal domain-containing protein [Aliarcobacter cryaerophilus]|uniref:Wzz/FepE/Etk N-terminal domain-containing protein n=1 Tax=Aliarcobacter cryaerophilus TaxID=28198 RepID=UPI0021B23D9D|nr:Wzz/FepE/Etk N-terminal domain-containing protein [Aliarcobacter cryaerophilus]MCT7526217.1 Wzz/FepE/Etk N-terminal domain-containing protein [Aliarcobacter cryaerophilus]MCT7542303.1 Wzz/FepE/Etk N-terminal domain-containing protein [Aliarcobacter cryaerophilus]
MQENRYIQEDEIDLRELFKIIWDKKIFIILFTLAITVLATVYAYSKTPIYEAKALVEIGEYKINNTSKNFVDDASNLEKKLSTLFVDMEKNLKDKTSQISNISVVKGLKNFLEIKSESTSNEEAKNEILKVLTFVQKEHEKILDDVKKQKEMELRNIDLQIADIKSKSVALIYKKIENNIKNLKSLEEQLKQVDENLKKIDTLNPSLAALKLMEKRDITNSINTITIQNFELESKKDELLTTTLYKLEESKKIIELSLLPHNYKNTQIVGEIMTNDFQTKPKKKLIVAVAFVTGFIISIFLVFLFNFIKQNANRTTY